MGKTRTSIVQDHLRTNGFAGTVERCTLDKKTGLLDIEIEFLTSEFDLKFLNTLARIFGTDDLEISGGVYCDCCQGSSYIHIHKATPPWPFPSK